MAESEKTSKAVFGRFFRKLKRRFDLREDSATQAEVVEHISKGTEFRGTNLWVLICAVFLASLGLNVNSTAVIIGAMLVSPLMGPIMGLGLALGTNDFQLMKKSLRNFGWMVLVSVVTSTFFFFISPFSSAQSELLARTSPTAFDVLIAFVGGTAGMLAQTRKDRTSTVISGVAIATALMPPLCTMGYGIATLQLKFIGGAAYLFLINTVFIAISTYMMVVFLKYKKTDELDKAANKRMHRWMWGFAIVVIVPSAFITVNIIRKTNFDASADKYVSSVFQFNKTMVVDYSTRYRYEGKQSMIEVRLVGEPLNQNVIDNARAQLAGYNLANTDLIIKQAADDERLDFSAIQKSYADIIDEKNSTIRTLQDKLLSIQAVDTIAVSDISREMSFVTDNINTVSLAKHISYDMSGVPADTTIFCFVKPNDPTEYIDTYKVEEWLTTRMKTKSIHVIVD